MEGDALVTVAAICHDHERFVVECLDSIRAQTYPRVELVVVDDCSADGSVAVIREWLALTGTAATFVALDANHGICRARNLALTHATGELVSFVSTDDWWRPEKLQRQVDALRARPEAGVVYGDAVQVDEAGRPLAVTVLEAAERGFPGPPEGDLYDALLVGNFIPPGPMVRRSCLDDVGPYDESLSYEDWDMWLRIARRHRFVFSPEVDIVKRDLPGSLWKARVRDHRASDVRILLKHVDAKPDLWPRIAVLAYESDDPHQRDYFLSCLRHCFSWQVLRFYLQAVVGLRRDQAQRVKRALVGLVDRVGISRPGRGAPGTPSRT